jgi:hypothetical protein
VPEGASLPGLTDGTTLKNELISRIERQLTSLYPRSRDDVERFQSEFRLPFQQMLGLKILLPQDVRAEVRQTVEGEDAAGGIRYRLHKLLLGRRDRGEAIPMLRLVPLRSETPSRGGAPSPPAVLLAHGQGKDAWARGQDGGEVWGRIAACLREGREVFFVDPWLIGEYHDPARRVGRTEDISHFTTYNRTDAALRAQDLVTASVYVRAEAGASGVDVWARGDAGLWALLARPFVPGLGRTLIEGQGYDLEDDDFVFEKCYVPGLRRLGGFRTAAILAAPAPLQIAGAGEGFSEFLRGVYRMMGREGDVT